MEMIVIKTPMFYNRNDIVLAKQPDKPEGLICKRITAFVSAKVVNLFTVSHDYLPTMHLPTTCRREIRYSVQWLLASTRL